MAKVYIANTPLILENAQGNQFRVEAGEAVELTAEQYESVAAHVTPTLTTGEELDAQQNDTPPSEDIHSQMMQALQAKLKSRNAVKNRQQPNRRSKPCISARMI